MIILLYGPDIYRSKQKLKEIVEQYKKTQKNGLSFQIIDLKEESFNKFFESEQSLSLFSKKKFLVLKNAFANQEFKDKFIKNKEKLLRSDDIILFYEEGEILAKDKLFSILEKKAKAQEFEILKGAKLHNWVKKEFEKCGFLVSPQIIGALIFAVGSDTWQLANEIQKGGA